MWGDGAPHPILHGMWDLSSPTRDQTLEPPALEAWTVNHWASTEVLNFVLLSFAFVQVYNLLPVKDLSSFPSSVNQQEEDNEDCISHDNVYINGIMYFPVSNTNEKDMYSFLQVSPLYCWWSLLKVHKILSIGRIFILMLPYHSWRQWNIERSSNFSNVY